jgi:hypothetical protein
MTNTAPGQFDTVTMSSNSPQAFLIADSLNAAQAAQPNQHFREVGDVLIVPELSMASPWLDQSSGPSGGISDEAYEKIPAQLLLLLRPDSIGSAVQTGGTIRVQFTGLDSYAYAIESSSNLVDWARLSTNYPSNGVFNFVEIPSAVRRFYRSVLLP